jgi:hypothetical protein
MNKGLLNQPGDRTVFKVPENYFADFGAVMNARIDAFRTEGRNQSDDSWNNNAVRKKGLLLVMDQYRPIMYMASMFVLLLFSVGLLMHYTSGSSGTYKSQAVKEQPAQTAEDYLISNLGTYSISQYYIESELAE